MDNVVEFGKGMRGRTGEAREKRRGSDVSTVHVIRPRERTRLTDNCAHFPRTWTGEETEKRERNNEVKSQGFELLRPEEANPIEITEVLELAPRCESKTRESNERLEKRRREVRALGGDEVQVLQPSSLSGP